MKEDEANEEELRARLQEAGWLHRSETPDPSFPFWVGILALFALIIGFLAVVVWAGMK